MARRVRADLPHPAPLVRGCGVRARIQGAGRARVRNLDTIIKPSVNASSMIESGFSGHVQTGPRHGQNARRPCAQFAAAGSVEPTGGTNAENQMGMMWGHGASSDHRRRSV